MVNVVNASLIREQNEKLKLEILQANQQRIIAQSEAAIAKHQDKKRVAETAMSEIASKISVSNQAIEEALRVEEARKAELSGSEKKNG